MEEQIFNQLQKIFVQSGNQSMIENIKMLLYQTEPSIFDRIDFDNDIIYQEPLLFAYFRNINTDKTTLDAIVYGYTPPHLRPLGIRVFTDEFGRIYLPNIGWLTTSVPNKPYNITTKEDNTIALWVENKPINYKFEGIRLIEDINIELLNHSIPVLKQFYYDILQTPVEVEIQNITLEQEKNFITACRILKKIVPDHYQLITLTTKKCVIFNIDTHLRNSFATLSAQGIGFFNAYQSDYNEVFFVDDIAHQTGHIVFNAMIYEVENFLLVEPNTIIQNLQIEGIARESRDIHVIFHALYTYYTTFICLDACLEADVFKDAKRHEVLGRIKFYIKKCYQDISLIENPTKEFNNTTQFYGSDQLFTSNGLVIYNEIKRIYNLIVTKWFQLVKDFDINNQPYNFTYSKFIELNPYVCSTQNTYSH